MKKFLFIFFLLPTVLWAEIPATLKVCDDIQEWPPYIYFKRIAGEKTKEIQGASVDYLKKILDKKGISFSVELIPWEQCLADLKIGKYDLLLNASFNAERNRSFLVTHAYYSLTPVYFYNKARPRPQIEKIKDLKKYKLCGVKGYNYRSFWLEPDDFYVREESVPEALQRLQKNDCQVLPERLESVLGYKQLGKIDISEMGIDYVRAPEVEPITFHIMVSRSPSYAKELFLFLNQHVKENTLILPN